jgi:hypothetical protein
VGLCGGVAPQHLGDGGAAQRAQVLGPEVRVDVDVEIQRTTGIRGVAVEDVSHAIRAPLQVDLRSQQQRHAQMGVDVQRGGHILRHATQPALGVELEPGELRQAPIAAVAARAEGAAARSLALAAALVVEPRRILFRVARRVPAPGQSQRRRRGDPLHEGAPIERRRTRPHGSTIVILH